VRAYIVGKGPSVNNLTGDDFNDPAQSFIITLNEAIEPIEQLNLPHKIFSMQQDGRPECMRRPKKATLVLSKQESKDWFPDYSDRIIYDRVKQFGLDIRDFSVLSAMAFAKVMHGDEFTFIGFDACTCGSLDYYDPTLPVFEKPEHFLIHCDLIALSAWPNDITWRRPDGTEKDQRAKDFTVITPTGDRHHCLKLCRFFLGRQTILPKEWIIIDDGQKPINWQYQRKAKYVRREPKVNDPDHTLRMNLFEAFKHITTDKIIIMEDDDWYARDHCEMLFNALDDYDLCGQGFTYYYNIPHQSFRRMNNNKHASFCQTAFTSKVIPILRQLCNRGQSPFLDIELWQHFDGSKKILPANPATCIGMKGMPGRPGQTTGHKNPIGFIDDSNGEILNQLVGSDDFLYREEIVS